MIAKDPTQPAVSDLSRKPGRAERGDKLAMVRYG